MSQKPIQKLVTRKEFTGFKLKLGRIRLDLSDYLTTGLRVVCVGPSGAGKTNAGLVMAEQLAKAGWICVLIDPEGEMEVLYGTAVKDPEELRERLILRDQPMVVVSAKDATEFVSYGRVILEVADSQRKPIFVVCDEGQVFSQSRKRSNSIGEASDILNDMFMRGRKRALDVFITTLRFSASVHRTIFANKNLTLVGVQEDPAAWSSMAPQFRASDVTYNDLSGLQSGEFICFSRRGVDKVKMQMAESLKRADRPAGPSRTTLPANFVQWDRAMQEISLERLEAIDDEIMTFLGTLSGLTAEQLATGYRALIDEIEARR